jgi:nitrate/TMAO reductase-like tetraheme cytochrome c subunit
MSALCASAWLFAFYLNDIIKDLEELNDYHNELIGKYIELATFQEERKELYEQEIEELKNKLKENNIEL